MQSKNTKLKTPTTMRLRPGLRPGPHWAPPDSLAGKGEWPRMAPGTGNPERLWEEEKGRGKGKLLPPDVRVYN